MVRITPKGIKSRLLGELPDELNEMLNWTLSYVSPMDLTRVDWLYYNKVLYSGMAWEVAAQLEKYGIECAVDYAQHPDPEHTWDFLFQYRPLQEEAVNNMLRIRNGILKAPPGTGKTVIMAAMTAKIGLPTFIVVQNKDPFDQAYRTLTEATTIGEIGQIGDSKRDVRTVNVATIQTLLSELRDNPSGPVANAWRTTRVVFADECHHVGADSYISAFNALEKVDYVYGASATPEDREDGRGVFVTAFLGPVTHEITYEQAIEHKLLVPVTVYIRTAKEKMYGYTKPLDDEELIVTKKEETTQDEVRDQYRAVEKDYIIESQDRNQMAIDFAKAAVKAGKSVAIIVRVIPHAEKIKSMWKDVVILHAKTKDRKGILEKLRKKEIKAVVTTLFDEAVDIPSLDSVALIAGGKSSIKLIQRVRCLRVDPENPAKNRGFVFYIRDKADFLSAHSTKCITRLKQLVKEAPHVNEVYDDHG